MRRDLPFAIGSPTLIWQVIFFYLPLLLMILMSVMQVSEVGVWEGLTLQNFIPILKPVYLKVIFASLLLALGTGVICFVIAYPLAHFIAFRAGKYKNMLLILLILPFWTNFLMHIYAWYFVLEKQGFLNQILLYMGVIREPVAFLNSMFSVMLMMVYYFLPFMTLPIYASLERFDARLIEASMNLGASWWRMFRDVMLPLTLPAVRTGFFLVFLPAFGEFVIPELMGGDKVYFVGSVMSQYVLGDTTRAIGSAFTVMSCLILLAATLLIFWGFKQFKRVIG